WIDLPDEKVYESIRNDRVYSNIIREYYYSGGNVFLSNHASLLPEMMEIESNKPEVRTQSVTESGYGRKYGFQSFRGHPVFTGLFGGAYIIDKDIDTVEHRIGYFDGAGPVEGKVIGIEKAYVRMHQQNKLLIEYERNNAKIISAGAFIDLTTPNLQERSQRLFLNNIFGHLSGKNDSDNTYWGKEFEKVYPFEIEGFDPAECENDIVTTDNNTGMILSRDRAEEYFFDLAGRRCMLIAKESGGVHEVWTHPFRIMQKLEIGIIEDGKVLWLNELEPSIEVRPESVKRKYILKDNTIEEIIFVSIDKPGGAIQIRSDNPVKMILRFNTDFRYMWPYDSGVLGDLFSSIEKKSNTVHIRDNSGDFYSVFGLNNIPIDVRTGQYKIEYSENSMSVSEEDNGYVSTGFLFELNDSNKNSAAFIFSGSNIGKEDAFECYKSLSGNIKGEYSSTVEHYNDLLKNKTGIISPDENFNRGYKWAIVGTDRFYAITPGVGGGLLAGIGNSESGWDGAQEISGRPGYAWYFGRDACWSAFAVNNYGDFGIVKDQIELFRKYQDISGKIYHELSTSGVVHYDAADSTPMYVMLAAHYLRSAGDKDYIKDIWPSVEKAMDYLYSTDFNNDGLIENFRVGHGWIEGGPLYPPLTTLYLAGLWAQTLKDASYMADILNKNDLSRKYSTDHENVIGFIEEKFWNAETQYYDFCIKTDGSFEPEKTIMPAVLMDFKLIDRTRAQSVLNEWAGSGFSTDWGVRIIKNNSKHYNPESYHSGSVWPLYTGWTAMAEYNYGRSVSAYRHVMNNLNVYRDWTQGFVEEVLHGDIYMKHGVCPHQCWSESNIIYPLISGMIGFEPDTPNGKVNIFPRFPADWDRAEVNNLWAGSSKISFKMQRIDNRISYRFELMEGPEIEIDFRPEIMHGMTINCVWINNENRGKLTRNENGLADKPIKFKLSGITDVSLEFYGGIGIIPIDYNPEPGDITKELKVLDSSFSVDSFTVDIECCRDGSNELKVILFNSEIGEVNGAKIIDRTEDTYRLGIDVTDAGYTEKQITINLINK
ncbi:MAG: hypothetical protein GY863_09260, partial [bacterium]|nr:hypothetical protein [bacterium]